MHMKTCILCELECISIVSLCTSRELSLKGRYKYVEYVWTSRRKLYSLLFFASSKIAFTFVLPRKNSLNTPVILLLYLKAVRTCVRFEIKGICTV